MLALLLADIHIKLGQKNVPAGWQRDRILSMHDQLPKDVDVVIIAGDLLDTAKPTMDELGLMYEFLRGFDKPVWLIPGNHEMRTKTEDCYTYIEAMLKDLNVEVIRDFQSRNGVDFIPYNILHQPGWEDQQVNKFAVTHVRGEIPPHVTPEVDLARFSGYSKVFTGDLHSFENCQGNLYYPGSPITTAFHRNVAKGANGYFLIDMDSGEHTWFELNLPQLLRKSVRDPNEIVPTEFHHTIYELHGDIGALSDVASHELLDRKVTTDISTPAKLNLTGSIADELAVYLKEVQNVEDVSEYITLFKGVVQHDQD